MSKTCPYLKRCFKEGINKGHIVIEKEKCNDKEKWIKCSIVEKSKLGQELLELTQLRKNLEKMLE